MFTIDSPRSRRASGFSLIELIVGIVVISLALVGLLTVYQRVATGSVDPIVRVRLLELAQSQLDVALAQPYDAATPIGGVPACGSITPEGPAPVCTGTGGINALDGSSATPYPGYSTSVSVTDVDDQFEVGLNPGDAKRVSVIATAPSGESLTLTAYRANF